MAEKWNVQLLFFQFFFKNYGSDSVRKNYENLLSRFGNSTFIKGTKSVPKKLFRFYARFAET